MGAAGPTQYIVIVNGRVRSFNKASGAADGAMNFTTDNFFTSVRNGLQTSDPRVRYDRLSGRWFFSMINVSTLPATNRVLIAFSPANAAITGSTTFTYRSYEVGVRHPGCFWDYDTLGIDVSALYIGGNIFCGTAPGTFSSSNGLVIGKASLLAGTLSATDFQLAGSGTCPGAEGLFSPQGVDNYDSAATSGYFAGSSNCFLGELAFARISNPGGMPGSVLLTLAVAPTMTPNPVPAKLSNHPLDPLDDRLYAAHLRNGHLWTAHTICVDTTGVAPAGSCPAAGRDASRWYDVTNLDTTPTLNQSGTVFDPTATNPAFYWIPSIMVSGQGHAAMGTSVAGNNSFAGAATMGRLAGDPAGLLGPPAVYQASASAYNAELNPSVQAPCSTGCQRWGDYSYTSLDPNDDMTMWTVQEFTNATNSWGVEVVQLKPPPPATPSSASGGPFPPNRASHVVSVIGTSTGGSGFFDPGNGFANHLQASLSGGVTVNSVTYLDPTHITLDISTVGAPLGPKNLTVTNPDGQVVTANGFLSITNGDPYNPLPPKRVADTRCPPGGPDPYGCTVLGPFATHDIQVTGPAGSGQPPADASAVVLNITAINYRSGGYLTVFPTGAGRPNASNLNLSPGTTIANLVEVSLGTGGQVSIYNDVGLTDVIVDVEGFVGPEATPGSGLFKPRPPARIVDTRSQYNPPYPAGSGSLGSFSTLDVNVAGATSITGEANVVPPTGASAVVLNVTATGGARGSYMTVYPAGQLRPRASNINFSAGSDVPNRVIVPLGTGGAGVAGHIKIYNESGPVDVVVDINGWFTDGSSVTPGGLYLGQPPVRIADSRASYNIGGYPRLAAGRSVFVQVAGVGGVPAFNSANPPTSVVLNVTVVGPASKGYYTIYPADAALPVASDLNFAGGQTVPNLVVVKLSSDGYILITNNSGGSSDFIVDVSGWYS